MDNYKEYLNPKDGYALVKSSIDMPVHPTWIEIPAGATTAIYYVLTKKVYFWKGEDVHWDTGEWMDCKAAQLTTVTEFLERNESRIVWKRTTQEPALISGADVSALIKKGESVQFRSVFNVQGGGEWQDLDLERDEEEFSLGDLINTRFEWRLKPQTIKLELEMPKPFKPRDGDDCFIVDSEQEDGFYRFTYSEDSGFHQNFIQFGAYKTEDDVKKAVEQLRKIRGTNS
ncbi:hypothetical protein NLHDIDDJ_02889 [Acinetobacter baumannii]|uniref:hypothetical protein n=1 Tax=Acinetobacter baumannii TaxID=470 RepID=UPI001E34BBDB|nr:hypothetical protein [Acinetobacter baumannii]UDY21223.1 hypothetical protein NLHDIDDJ_02889 [Acinetobacter baumannii]